MNIEVLPLSDVWERHSEKVAFSPDYTEWDFDTEWQTVRDDLRTKLQSRWKESCYGDADFALSDDRSNTWAQAGGIQNAKMLTRDFVRMVFDVIKTQPHSDRWGTLFSIQIAAGLLRRKAVTGEILLKNGVLCVAKYKNYDHDAVLAYFNET
ncbi:MAG TPA: hypothetical protein VNN22_16145 [Verrucomicrobiae bacterium]|nr:hypothetical protein [Verrucomicrobiae bacterium]